MRFSPTFFLGFFSFSFVIFLIAGCDAFADPSQKATENAESTQLWATVGAIETQSSTITALRATADSAALLAAQATQLSLERDQLRGTISVLSALGNNSFSSQPQPSTGGSPLVATPSTVDGGVAAGVGPTPAVQSGATYSQTTTTSRLTADRCAADTTADFATSTEIVYFVTVGQNIPAGTRFSLRISDVNGTVLNTDNSFWTSDDIYEQTCIWYGINADNITFEAGSYRVELLANDIAVTQTTFSLSGSDGGGTAAES